MNFLVEKENEHIKKEEEISFQAGELVGELYDEITMPIELREAHRENDKAVMEAYGFRGQKMKESECVRRLMELYKKIIDKE